MKQTLDDLPLLPTSAVGSHAPTGWLLTAIDAIARGEMGQDDIDELMRDATDIAVLDMERAGLDVLVDGEMRRNDFNLGFYVRIQGIEPMPSPRKLGPEGHDQRGKWRVYEELSAPNGLGCVEDFAYVQSISDRPVKASVPGPFTLSGPNPDWRDLQGPHRSRLGAGPHRQCRMPRACRKRAPRSSRSMSRPPRSIPIGWPSTSSSSMPRSQGIDAKIGSHICFGNFRGRPVAQRTYRPIFPAMFDMRCDQYLLEFANREMAEIELWKEFPNDRELGCGVIDVKNYWCETPDVVAERIRTALKFVAPDKLWIVPDCGFSQTARWATKRKLAAMVEGARSCARSWRDERAGLSTGDSRQASRSSRAS